MKALLIVLAILGTLIFIPCCSLVVGYNGLNTLNQDTNKHWADVQNVYQRRADLVPQLVATVEGSANFEKSTLLGVTQARASVGQIKIDASQAPKTAEDLAAFDKAQGQLGQALSHLMVVSEKYPDIKSTQNFANLQASLEGTENRIAVERRKFNGSVQDYDTAINALPARLYAGMFGFQPKPYFQADEAAQSAPKVHFDFNSK